MPRNTGLDRSPEEHAQLLAVLRRARDGSLLALHLVLLGAVRRHPTESAAALFCSRSSVYRPVRAYRAGTLGLACDAPGRLTSASAHHGADALSATVAVGMASCRAASLRLVPHTLEWCHAGSDV